MNKPIQLQGHEASEERTDPVDEEVLPQSRAVTTKRVSARHCWVEVHSCRCNACEQTVYMKVGNSRLSSKSEDV